MFDPIEVTAYYKNLHSGYVKDQDLNRKQLTRLVDTHPTFDDLDDNFISLVSSDDKAIFQGKRIEANLWEIDIPINTSGDDTESISFSIDHANLLQAMLDYYFKDMLFTIIYKKDQNKIREYLKREYFVR